MRPTASPAYPGGYSRYRLMKERDLEKQTAAWKDQEAVTRRIQGDITRTKQTALRTERSTTHDFYRRRAKKVARKAKVRERRLERLLTSSDRVERPSAAWKMKLDFGAPARGGTLALRLDGVGHGYSGRRLFQDVGPGPGARRARRTAGPERQRQVHAARNRGGSRRPGPGCGARRHEREDRLHAPGPGRNGLERDAIRDGPAVG